MECEQKAIYIEKTHKEDWEQERDQTHIMLLDIYHEDIYTIYKKFSIK